MDVGELVGIGKLNIVCEGVFGFNFDDVDVMIDFILLVVFDSNLVWCVQYNKLVVIGMMGLFDVQLISFVDVVKFIFVVFVVNYSVGVNLMLLLVK